MVIKFLVTLLLLNTEFHIFYTYLFKKIEELKAAHA